MLNRRQFLGLIGSSTLVLIGLSCNSEQSLSKVSKSSHSKPNIILITADDMGFSDLGCYGGEINTPNIDNLARKGIRYSQFYNSSVCCPTRASMLTGLYSHQAGLGHMVKDPQLPTQMEMADKGYPGYLGYLNDRCITIAEGLKLAGYHTMMSGKWHTGETRPHWPVDRGFDRHFGLIGGGVNYFDPVSGMDAPYFPKDGRRQIALDGDLISPDPNGFYMTDAITDYALEFLDEQSSSHKPFFLHVSYTTPHIPLQALPEDIEKYRGRYMQGWDQIRYQRHCQLIKMGLLSKKSELTPQEDHLWPWHEEEDKEWMDLKMAIYAAQIDRMDQGIGKIMTKISQMGVSENTLVMFLSDNGGCSWGGPNGVDVGRNQIPPGNVNSYMSYGEAWANASNTPFRLYKTWLHEGGISTPFIAYWPSVITQQNAITHQPGHVMDIMATCLDAAGIEYPKQFRGREIIPLEGKSLIPIFQGKQRKPHDCLCWEFQGNRAIRKGKWKLVEKAGHINHQPEKGDWRDWSTYVKHRKWELYDMEADRTELHDLSSQYPNIVTELKETYMQWANRCGVQPWPDS